MRAIAIDRFGGPEVLTMHTLPVPVPGASEVLIAVHTAEVGGRDEPFRARVFAEPASFAPLRTGFQRTAQMESWSLFQLRIFLVPSERN